MSGFNQGCCCDCTGIGQPFIKTWLADKETWLDATAYSVGDLVLVSSNSQYYVCKLAHTSEAATNDPVTDTTNTWWEDAERQLNCMYVELANIGMADCRILWKVAVDDPGIVLADFTGSIRLDEVSGSPPTIAAKWLLRQKRKATHPDLLDGLGTYGDRVGKSCHWIKRCNCGGTDAFELKFTTINAVNQRFLHRQDSVHTDYSIQINILDATQLEVLIYGWVQFMRSSAYDGNLDREDPPNHQANTVTDTPCKYASAPGMFVETFRGTGTIPANWVDSLGEPSANIVVTNDYLCGDIGKRIFKHPTITHNDIFIAGGGGTVTIKPPFAEPWTPGDSVVGCSAITSPADSICHPTGADPPYPEPPLPPFPPGPGPGPGPNPPGPGPDPPNPKKPKWRSVRYCDGGGFTGFWVPDGGYPLGTVLKVQFGSGPACVVIGTFVRAETPPGPLLGGVLSNYGQRGCRKCQEHWDFTPCPSESGSVRHTDNDLGQYEGKVVKVDGECGTVNRAVHAVATEDFTPGEEFDDCDECECPGLPPDSLPSGDPPTGYASSYTIALGGYADCTAGTPVVVTFSGGSWSGVNSDGNSANLILNTTPNPNEWQIDYVCGVPGGDNDAQYTRVCESITGTYDLASQGHDCSGTCLFGATATVS
jgi:hypothetical protein